jgi:hypothetical protein
MNDSSAVMSDLESLLQEKQELNGELVESIIESKGMLFIQHPLLTTLYCEQLNAFYNRSLEQQKESIAEALEKNDLEQVIFLHSRPFRMNALIEMVTLAANRRRDVDQIARLILSTWVDAEWPGAADKDVLSLWLTMFNQYVRDSELGRKAREHVPEQLFRGTIGYEIKHRRLGLSWTASKERAIWFATRSVQYFGGVPIVYSVQPKREEILAIYCDRSEDEFILDPTHLYPRIKQEKL